MMQLEKVSRLDWVLGGLAAFLVIDLVLFPWIDISVGAFSISIEGTGEPDGWLGVLAVIGALAFLADLAVERFSEVQLPALGGDRARTRLILAAFAAVCVGLKFLFHLGHLGDYGIGAWLALLAAGGLVYISMRPDVIR